MSDHVMNELDDIDLSVWTLAATRAVSQFSYGDTIPLEWVRANLEINELDEDDLMTVKQHRSLAFDLLRKTEMFKQTMLETHKRLLVNIRGCGYKVVEPPHQTEAAMRKFISSFHKNLHQAMTALVHINESALTLDDTRRNIEAKARLQYLKRLAGDTLLQDAMKETRRLCGDEERDRLV
jgi:hypothetical protein